MKQVPLGRSGTMVSDICLGTMTWGSQNTEAEAHAQLDRATERGITFLDTAEMYPTNPMRPETVGRTEDIIGNWLRADPGRRARLTIATKITGAGSAVIPGGPPITPARLRQAFDASLQRLGVETIDLYQLHWPNRGSYHFRRHWSYDPSGQSRAETLGHMAEILETVEGLVKAGKLRHFGLSNETTWGTAQWLRLADENGLPRAVSIQNEYSLLDRKADTDIAELCVNEQVSFLAFSPLAAGLLTGKYAGDVIPEGSRRAATPDLGGRIKPRVWEAVAACLGVANEAGLDPARMAIAWCRQRPFPVIPIIGATSLAQLDNALDASSLELGDEVRAALDAVWQAHPLPY